jgi:muconolactone delta-isomerase
MQYLVQMTFADSTRPALTTPQGRTILEQYLLPTLERCEELSLDKTVVAGGPVVGSIALALVLSADSPEELDRTLMSLPVWPLMRTTVTPLTTFERRAARLKTRLESSQDARTDAPR